MANTTRQANTEPSSGDAESLKGGTEPTTTPVVPVGGVPGGTAGLNAVGGSRPPHGPTAPPGGAPPTSRGTANEAQQDAEAAFEGQSRHPSATEAKQWARDDADVDTTAGTPFGGVAPDRQVHKMQEDKD